VQDLQAPTPAPVLTRTAAERRAHLMRELVETLLFVGLVFLIVQFAVKPYRVGGNMQPQLQPDQLVVVNKVAYLFSSPSRGDVVVYVNPGALSEQLIGRVIAVPGDTLTITATEVIVNGVSLSEGQYVAQAAGGGGKIIPPTKLGKDDYWIMNDARLAQDAQGHFKDSRDLGPIARPNIVGKAVIVFWPLSNLAGISTFPSVFAGIH
jgi:signal peptidase I